MSDLTNAEMNAFLMIQVKVCQINLNEKVFQILNIDFFSILVRSLRANQLGAINWSLLIGVN